MSENKICEFCGEEFSRITNKILENYCPKCVEEIRKSLEMCEELGIGDL
jgi:predicted amidophosphoribosyltransferase